MISAFFCGKRIGIEKQDFLTTALLSVTMVRNEVFAMLQKGQLGPARRKANDIKPDSAKYN